MTFTDKLERFAGSKANSEALRKVLEPRGFGKLPGREDDEEWMVAHGPWEDASRPGSVELSLGKFHRGNGRLGWAFILRRGRTVDGLYCGGANVYGKDAILEDAMGDFINACTEAEMAEERSKAQPVAKL